MVRGATRRASAGLRGVRGDLLDARRKFPKSALVGLLPRRRLRPIVNGDHPISRDRRVYVGERGQNRIQVFTTDGKWLQDIYVSPNSPAQRGECGGLNTTSALRAGTSTWAKSTTESGSRSSPRSPPALARLRALGSCLDVGRLCWGTSSRPLTAHRDIGFQATHVIFPTPGCWEVTAQVGERRDSKITFVTRVVRIGEGPARTARCSIEGSSTLWAESCGSIARTKCTPCRAGNRIRFPRLGIPKNSENLIEQARWTPVVTRPHSRP